ncbi:MAG: NarK/NasA family nitrate transporter [bacterium]|nr:NarK/NasA family nitrate transporter [bacterium]
MANTSADLGKSKSSVDIYEWDVEDDAFWEREGKKVATRNLWISIPSLLCGFAVWLYWSVITVQMLNLGFPFTTAELFTLSSIAGLTGATLRIPSSFFIRLAGGRNTIFFTTALLMIPAAGTGFALLSQDTPLWVFQLMAFLSGLGGGNFASSMSNISFFYPKKMQGLSLGLNAGLGNAGVTTMQIVVPAVMTMGVFGGAMVLEKPSGTLIGKIAVGTEAWIHNAGFVWLVFLIPLAFLGWFKMNNIRTEHVSPNIGSPLSSFAKISGLLGLAFIPAAIGLWLILPSPTGLGLTWARYPVIGLVIWATVMLLKQVRGEIKPNLERQFKIFGHKHTWIMSVIYTMTFGSFIGYSAGFALAIKVIFGFQHVEVDGILTHDLVNPNGPSALTFAWMGPFIGAFIRPLGGWIADKVGGAKVTQWVSVTMIASALGVAYYMNKAYTSATPEDYFVPFFLLFLVLFAATGVGNGSTFRTIAVVFDKEQAGPVLGWTSAVAAYGAFIIPIEFGDQIKAATPQYALMAFAAFYTICLVLNWWYYLGPKAEYQNP